MKGRRVAMIEPGTQSIQPSLRDAGKLPKLKRR
jgi:hypothetical protein